MLDTTPERRYTIKDVMRSRWISQYVNVPQTPLPTTKIFQEDLEQLPEIKQVMSIALNEMRVNYDIRVQLKDVNVSQNPMLARRKERKEKNDKLPPPPEEAQISISEASNNENSTNKTTVTFKEPSAKKLVISDNSSDNGYQTPMNLSRPETPSNDN
jgi:hypothetical protein